jgi:hypothetical protein
MLFSAMSLLPPTSTPTPAPRNFDRTRSAEIFDLLDGLDADDLEFELDDEPVPAGGGKKETAAEAGPGPSTAARRSTSPSPSLEPGYDAPDPIPTTIPITVSFATARGAALARPSDVAMKRALKIMREAERDVEIDGGDRGKRPRLSLTPPAPEPMLSQSRSHSHAVDAPAPAPAPAPVPAAGQARASGFAMASGTVAPSLSADARARVAALFTDDAPRLPPPASLFASASPTKPSSSGFQTGAGGAAPGLSSAARAQALALFANETPTSSTPPEPNLGSQAPSASPARFRPPLLASHSMSTPVRPSPAFVAPRRTQTPSRMPLYPVENGHAGKAGQAGPSTPAPAGIKLPRGLEIRTPSAGTPRRIGLGIGATPSGKRPRRFATPFKTPASVGPKVGAATATAMSPLAVRTPAYPRQGKPSSASASEVKAERIWKPVFDLERASSLSASSQSQSLSSSQSPAPADA